MYTNPRSQHFRFRGANAYATREHVARRHPGVEADRARVLQRYVRPRWGKRTRCMCARQTSRSSDFDSRSRDFCNAPADSSFSERGEKMSRLFFPFPHRRQSRPRYGCSLDGPAFPGAFSPLPSSLLSPFPGVRMRTLAAHACAAARIPVAGGAIQRGAKLAHVYARAQRHTRESSGSQ